VSVGRLVLDSGSGQQQQQRPADDFMLHGSGFVFNDDVNDDDGGALLGRVPSPLSDNGFDRLFSPDPAFGGDFSLFEARLPAFGDDSGLGRDACALDSLVNLDADQPFVELLDGDDSNNNKNVDDGDDSGVFSSSLTMFPPITTSDVAHHHQPQHLGHHHLPDQLAAQTTG
jgi:hypothetical protein